MLPSLISFRMCLSSGFKVGEARWGKAKVDRPFRRAMPTIMRLCRLALASSKGLLDPPNALSAETLHRYATRGEGRMRRVSRRLKSASFQTYDARPNKRNFFLIGAICAISLKALAQSADPSA